MNKITKIRSSVRTVVEGSNQITVPNGSRIAGFISSGHGLGIVVTHPETLPDEIAQIMIAVVQVGSTALTVPEDVRLIHVGTLCDYEDNIFTAYGYEIKKETVIEEEDENG